MFNHRNIDKFRGSLAPYTLQAVDCGISDAREVLLLRALLSYVQAVATAPYQRKCAASLE